jgi:hypothetical protein
MITPYYKIYFQQISNPYTAIVQLCVSRIIGNDPIHIVCVCNAIYYDDVGSIGMLVRNQVIIYCKDGRIHRELLVSAAPTNYKQLGSTLPPV